MKVLHSWLQEFLDAPVDPTAVADAFDDLGTPVEEETRSRADESSRTFSIAVRAEAGDCCGVETYAGTLILSSPEGPELRVPLDSRRDRLRALLTARGGGSSIASAFAGV